MKKIKLTKLSRPLHPHGCLCGGFRSSVVNEQYSACTALGTPSEDFRTNTEVSRADPYVSSATVGSFNRISYSSGHHLRFRFCSCLFCWLYGKVCWTLSPIQKSEIILQASFSSSLDISRWKRICKKQVCHSVGNLCDWLLNYVLCVLTNSWIRAFIICVESKGCVLLSEHILQQ